MVNYRFYKADNKIIALSSFAGKTIKGVAKCDPSDTFSVEFGEKLAAARCNKKVADKRVKYAMKKYLAAEAEFKKVQKHFKAMSDYLTDSSNRCKEAATEVDNLLNSIEG